MGRIVSEVGGLEAAYAEYVPSVSSADMAISRELARYLWELCEARRPRRILDLGSGFSSYVFARWASEQPEGERPELWVVDAQDAWLGRTLRFLAQRGLRPARLLTWERFRKEVKPEFDLVLHDLGDLGLRRDTVTDALARIGAGGAVVLDDLHYPEYRAYVREQVKAAGLRPLSLRVETRDNFGRYAWLVERPMTRITERISDMTDGGQVAVVTLVTREKAYVLEELLESFRELEAPAGARQRFVVVQAGELDPEADRLLAAFGAERELELVNGPPVDPRAGHPWWRALVAGELRERARLALREREDDWVLWIDCDVLAPPDTVTRLISHRRALASALVLNRVVATPIAGAPALGRVRFDPAAPPPADAELTLRPGTMEVGWVGFGCYLTRADLVREIEYAPYLSGETTAWAGEDGYWCQEARDRFGESPLIDTRLCPWHVDERLVGVQAAWDGERLERRLRSFGAAGGFLIPRVSGESPRFGRLELGIPFSVDAQGRPLSLEEMRAVAARSQVLDFLEPGDPAGGPWGADGEADGEDGSG